MTADTTALERWVHKADGSFIQDNPFVVVGTKIKCVHRDEDWGADWVGSIGVIDERSAVRNKVGTDKRVYAVWTKAGDAEPYDNGSPNWFYRSSIEVIDVNA